MVHASQVLHCHLGLTYAIVASLVAASVIAHNRGMLQTLRTNCVQKRSQCAHLYKGLII